jgi:hypothetical protein
MHTWCMARVCRSRAEGGMTCRPAVTTDLAAETESRLEMRRSSYLVVLFLSG